MRKNSKTPIKDWFGFLTPSRKVGRQLLSSWVGPYPEDHIVEMTENIVNSASLYVLIQEVLRGNADQARVFGRIAGLAEIEWEGIRIRNRDIEGLNEEKKL